MTHAEARDRLRSEFSEIDIHIDTETIFRADGGESVEFTLWIFDRSRIERFETKSFSGPTLQNCVEQALSHFDKNLTTAAQVDASLATVEPWTDDSYDSSGEHRP